MKISIIIPNWNGRRLLEKNLPAVLAAGPDEVIVVDDASEDNSVSFLKKKYPKVKIVQHEKNSGFASSCNDGVAASMGEIIVLLNSDVIPEKDLFEFFLPHFKDPRVFAVSFNESQWSWARICWKGGFVEHEPGPKPDKTHITAWASGGSGAFRKSVWEELEGFDTLYKPFYWEDVDLSYRAWKRGYKVLWEPKAVVNHKHEGIIGAHFSKSYINSISQRNQLIFIWKNITDLRMSFKHRLFLVWRLKSPSYFKVFLSALLLSPAVFARRIEEKSKAKVSDREIFNQFEREK